MFLMSSALAACSAATSARPVSPGFTGYDWQVVAISHGGKVTSIPARMQVALQFSPGGQFGANDSINFHSGTYRTTSDGFMTSALASTRCWAGCARCWCVRAGPGCRGRWRLTRPTWAGRSLGCGRAKGKKVLTGTGVEVREPKGPAGAAWRGVEQRVVEEGAVV
jgi:hypothetical protein